jgi:trk system potassium uptake protein TrkH
VNIRLITRMIGILIVFLGLSMSAPLIVSLVHADGSEKALLYSIAVTCSLGIIIFALAGKSPDNYLSHRDGVVIVSLGWIVACAVATIPYLLSGSITTMTDAYFECMSGFTTTGASIVKDIEKLPMGILLWRSETQWLGGMGIIVLTIAILPFLGIGGMQLYKAETPSPVVDKLTPRIADTAASLWKIYIVFTVVQIALLFGGGMPLFDAVCHTFTTMPTGGFSTKNASIAHYHSLYFDFIIVVFMMIAGTNFSLYYKLFKGQFTTVRKDPELRMFWGVVIGFSLLVTYDIYGNVYDSVMDAFRYATFQVVSMITTTGFATADFVKWPAFSQLILLICMFLGSMAGSTGGAIKIMRIILLLKHSYLEIFRIIHPHATTVVKLGDMPVPQSILRSIWGFFALYIGLFVIATLFMSLLGLDMISSISSVATCIGNVGPGLGSVGPMDNFSGVPFLGKWILIFCMLLGRLEIYTIIVLLMPGFWKR